MFIAAYRWLLEVYVEVMSLNCFSSLYWLIKIESSWAAGKWTKSFKRFYFLTHWTAWCPAAKSSALERSQRVNAARHRSCSDSTSSIHLSSSTQSQQYHRTTAAFSRLFNNALFEFETSADSCKMSMSKVNFAHSHRKPLMHLWYPY